MAFSDAKLLQQSKKFNLIRLNPARYISDDLTLDSGTTYQMTFPFLGLNKIKVNGSQYTKVNSSPSSGEWSFNESTKLFQINFGASLTDQAVVGFYYLFYTTGVSRVVPQNPEVAESSSNPLRDWVPQITKAPTVSFSMENILQGTFSVSASSIEIINDNYDFNQYLTANDSFFKKDVSIWIVLNDLSNIEKQFEGEISSINVTDELVSLSIKNPFQKLKDTATLGDNSDEIYFKKSRFSELDPNEENKPIRYVVGKVSKYQLRSEGSFLTGSLYALEIDSPTCFKATNINYSENISTTTNREWGICRVSSDGFLQFSDTISAPDNSQPSYTRVTVTNSTQFLIGDTFVIDRGGSPVYSRVINTDHGNNYLYLIKSSTPLVAGDTIGGNDCPTIMIQSQDDNSHHYLQYGRDYTTTITTNAGGSKFLKVTFINNFESAFPFSTFDPSNHKVYWRVRPNQTNGGHAEVLKDILDKSGLNTNASSFSTAQTSLDTNVNFTIPFYNKNSYKKYIDYVQEILKSTFGFLTLNNSFEIEYKLFDTPSGGSALTDTDILDGSPTIEIDYNDIAYSLIAFNPHYASQETVADSDNSPSVTVTTDKARYLHETENTIQFEHVLEKFNDVASKIAGFRAERSAKYIMQSKSINLDNIIGDNLELDRDNILGNDSTKQLKILSLSKATDKVEIITTDLQGV